VLGDESAEVDGRRDNLLNVTADPVWKYLAAYKGLEKNGHARSLLSLGFLPALQGSGVFRTYPALCAM